MKKTVKIIVAVLWLIVVGYFYFIDNHAYYLESFEFIGRIAYGLIGALVGASILLGLQIAWNHFKKRKLLEFKISLWKAVLGIMLITTGLLYGYQINTDLALYEGGTIFQDEESWGMLPEGVEPEEGMYIIIEDGTITTDANSLIEILPEEVQDNFTKVGFFQSTWFLQSTILLNLGALLLLVLGAYAIGHRVLRFTDIGKKWKTTPRALSEFLISTAIGLITYMMVVFVAAILGLATGTIVITALVILAGLSWRDVLGVLKVAAKGFVPGKIDIKSLSFWAIVAMIIMFTYNMLSIIRPMPIGWDDANYYMYIPEKIAQTGKLLVESGGMYNWELVNTIGAFTDDAQLQLFVNFGGGLLALAALYLFLKTFLKKETAITLTGLFYSIPTVIFQSGIDIKNDLPLLFFLLIAAYVFVKWLKNNDNKWLYLAALIIGVSVGIKITAGITLIIFISAIATKLTNSKGGIGVGVMMLGLALLGVGGGEGFGISEKAIQISGWILTITGLLTAGLAIRETKIKINTLKKVLVFFAIIFATTAPWVVKNTIIDGIPLGINSYHSAKADTEVLSWDPSEYCDLEYYNPYNEFEDYVIGRGDEESKLAGLISLIKMPWQMTMNPGFDAIYVDPTMIFLGLFPLMMWYLIERNDKTSKNIAKLAILYFAILIFFFKGIPWYGYMGVCGLLILVGKVAEDKEEKGTLAALPKIAITITIIMAVMIKGASFMGINQLSYTGNLIDSEKYVALNSPGLAETEKNLDRVDDEEALTIYRIGGSTSYHLASINAKFVYDERLDIYACMLFSSSYDEIVTIFQELGVEYIALDYTYALSDYLLATDAVANRYADLYAFGQENLEVVVEEGDYILFKIPDPA